MATYRTLGIFAVLTLGAATQAATYGPSPYLSFADSPFSTVSFNWFYNETFEDGALNTPGLMVNGGQILNVNVGGLFTDSVDADDGVIDGLGLHGNSWWTGFPGFGNKIVFSFDANVLGALPTHVGLVWTDSFPPGSDTVVFEAFDSSSNLVGSIGPSAVGDASNQGETGEDRFFGVSYAGGISRMELTMGGSTNFEVDHVQYGMVPEPSTLAAIAVGAACLRRRRRS